MNEEENFKDFLQTREENYKDFFSNSAELSNVNFQTSDMGIDLIYATMHIVAQKLLLQIDQSKSKIQRSLLDVGSQFSFISFASTFFDVTFIEPRAKNVKFCTPGLCDITGVSGEAQNLPFQDDKFDYVTSLHAIEHFGLGRYGDTLDYFGDQKGIAEFSRVLKPGGFLLTGVPASSISKIDFNEQRKYSPKDFDDIVAKTNLKKAAGMISYYPGVFSNGILVASEETLKIYPTHFTPPVYIAAYQKKV